MNLKINIMKKIYYTLLFLFATTVAFAQGISVQGIARDNASAAITDTNLTFTFSITKDDNTVLYAETQAIRTDDFGIFSHIIKSGNPVTNTFDSIDFSIDNLKLKVSVSYNAEDIEVYNQTLQYTPYAHYARNGVPTGSIMPFIGEEAPDGWVLCQGQDITSIDGAEALIALVGNNAPDLQGMFLRGTGTSPVNSKAGPALKATQGDDNKSHSHYASLSGSTAIDGSHSHSFPSAMSYNTDGNSGTNGGDGSGTSVSGTNIDGNHSHSVSVSGYTNSSGTESRPVNYGVNYIIKL